ncbi:MAG: hypothetical protein N2662_09995 [Bacteroidales bacterium]|nr:hypothetical protein [Bacteroidales bacterium]
MRFTFKKKENTTPKIILPRKDYKLRQKILNFLFFLFLSIIFWLLRVLDNDYTTQLTVPIEYIPYRSDVEMVGEIPRTLSLNVTGQGYTLVKRMFTSSRQPVVLQMLALNLRQVEGNENRYFALTHYLKENIQRQLGNELILNYILPDTLWYTFSPVERRKVKVIPDLKIKFVRQYMLEGDYIVQPESIMVTGPHIIIDTLSAIYTESESFLGVFRSFTRTLKLKPIDRLSFEPQEVSVTVPVEKFTQSTLKVPITPINVPDSLQLLLFPSYVSIEYLVSLKNFKKVKSSQFLVTADYFDCFTSVNKISVRIERYPYMLKLINYTPKSVEYLIEHKMPVKTNNAIVNDTPVYKRK